MVIDRRSVLRRLSMVVLLGACASGCFAAAGGWVDAPRDPAGAAPIAELAGIGQRLADLIERLKPALVEVQMQHDGTSLDPAGPPRSVGAGFIIDADGVVITSAHVVDGTSTVYVRLTDGRQLTASVLGRDERLDLAVLRVEGVKNLPTLLLGDSDRLRVGEFVLALGHPFGLQHSVSFGIVSRKGARPGLDATGVELIQTDAAINPGNSGGPLVNMAGQVIGVNSTAARTGLIGFAVPSNLLKTVVSSLITKDRAR